MMLRILFRASYVLKNANTKYSFISIFGHHKYSSTSSLFNDFSRDVTIVPLQIVIGLLKGLTETSVRSI